MKTLKITLFVSFLILICNTHYAQKSNNVVHPLAQSLQLTLQGGSNYSFTDYESSDLGLSFGGGLEYFFLSSGNNAFGLNLDLAKEYFKGKDNNLGLKKPAELFDTEATNIRLGFIYSYAFSDVFLPYAKIGASYLMLEFNSENIQSSFLDIKTGQDKSTLLYDFIGGMKFRVDDLITLNFGLGYHYVQNDNLDAIKFGDFEDFYFSGNIGVSFNLWQVRDSDGDGINDSDEINIYKTDPNKSDSDGDGLNDYDEIFKYFSDPNKSDTDDDGLNDYDEIFKYGTNPNKDDTDGDELSDGDEVNTYFTDPKNPDTDGDGLTDGYEVLTYNTNPLSADTDGDGIPDDKDECPNLPEDIDGFEDEDGCPDVDNDGDGILDVDDKCPDEPETFNGYQDDDGCPDEVPEIIIERPKVEVPTPQPRRTVSSAPSELTILSETTFASNSSQIKSSAYGELNKIVEELKKYPNTNWRIEGHIDKQSSRNEATRITKSQADAILSYFISQGLSASNFQAVGFGDANPVASNASVYGKMKNRRIIIRKLD
jgi:outer membrane protein OmpA-like peptidoglycan-associated protein